MSVKFDVAAGGAVLLGGQDLTRETKRFSSTENIAAEDQTGLQAPGFAMEFLAGLSSSAIQISGMLPKDQATVERRMRQALGLERDPWPLLVCPWGQGIGYYAEFLETIETRFNPALVTPNITSYSADFIGTGSLHRGTLLYNSQGPMANSRAGYYVVRLVAAHEKQRLAFTKGNTQSAEWNPGANNATLLARLEELFGTGNVTISGSVTSSGSSPNRTYTGFYLVGLKGELGIVEGEVQLFHPASPSGDYTINSSGNIEAGDSVSDIQAALRLTSGTGWSGVNVTGVSDFGTPGEDLALEATPYEPHGNGDRVIDGNLATSGSLSPGQNELIWSFEEEKTLLCSRIYIKEGTTPSGTLDFYGGESYGIGTQLQYSLDLSTVPVGEWVYILFDASGSFQYEYIVLVGGSAEISEVQLFDALPTLSELNLTLRFAPSAGNVSAAAVTGTGASAGYSTSHQGGTAPTQATASSVGNLNVKGGVFNADAVKLAGGTNGGWVTVQVPWASSDCNAIVRVQHADDSGGSPGSFSSVFTAPAITAAGSWIYRIPAGTTIKPWVRVAITSGGITGQLAFAVALELSPA